MALDETSAKARELCTVERKCSSTGKTCSADDRACQNAATQDGLEVICERSDPAAFVYCPPGAQQRDSTIVWVLLAVAFVIAMGGGLVAWRVLKARPEGSR